MRIVHVIDYFQPKLGYQETFLAREQLKASHEVFVVTSNRHRKLFYRDNAAAKFLGERIKPEGYSEEEGIPTYRLPVALEIAERVWIRGLEQQIFLLQPDVVHIHGMVTLSTARVARIARRLRKLHQTVIVIDDHMSAAVSRSWLTVLYPILRSTLLPWIAESADSIVAVTHAAKDFMQKKYGLSSGEIKVIELGVDAEVFRKDLRERNRIRRELHIPPDFTVFIYTGKMIPQKRLDLLLSAANQLVKEGWQLHVMLVGYAAESYIKSLFADYAELVNTGYVSVIEAVPNAELYCYFSAADVAVWPAEASISFLEAMACSLPLIVCNGPACEEKIRFQNGFIFEENNVEQLTAHMRTLLRSPELRLRMGSAGRDAVEKYFSWSEINRQFMKLYC